MTHEWLLRLVGRGHNEPDNDYPTPVILGSPPASLGLSVRDVADASEVSISTVRRR
jgi:hypothetical protein